MADNKKYYYMRLKENFFDDDSILLLESMQDGFIYTNILLKLYLKSLKSDGKLMFNDRIPYNPQMLATITRHQVGTVERALRLFAEMGLIEVLDSGAIYMMDIQNFIGSSSTEADRKREYRLKIESEKLELSGQMSGQMSQLPSGQMSGHSADKSIPEIEIELEPDTEREKENNLSIPDAMDAPKPPKPRKKSVPKNELEKAFKELWDMYPRKQGKANAFKDFEKAIKDGESIEAIKAGLIAAVKHWKVAKTEMQFIPMGSTWFHQKRWLDDLAEQHGQQELGSRFRIDIMG